MHVYMQVYIDTGIDTCIFRCCWSLFTQRHFGERFHVKRPLKSYTLSPKP